MSRKIPWEEIRNKYVYGIEKDGKIEFPSQRDLASEYGISPATIGERASKEKWAEAREQYLSERRAKSEQKVINEISDDVLSFDVGLFKQAQAIKEKLNELIANMGKPTEALTLANTLKALKELENYVLGEKNNIGSEAIQINVPSEDGKVGTGKVLSGERT